MSRTAKVFSILIATPCDVSEERTIVVEEIHRWNADHFFEGNIILEPILWDTHLSRYAGKGQQQPINEQLLPRCDSAIGIFWSRIGTKTYNEPGGAVYEISYLIDKAKPVIIFFSHRPIPPDQINTNQLEQVKKFQKKVEENGLFHSYSDLDEFRTECSSEITKLARQLISESSYKNYTIKNNEDSASSYNASIDRERLRIQADHVADFDNKLIEHAINMLNPIEVGESLKIMDAGCGNGYVTFTRFGNDERFSVVGFDNSKEEIDVAKREHNASNIVYKSSDLSLPFDDTEQFDIIFAAYLLHHCAHPESVMRNLWSILKKPGVLIIRNQDDALKITYPDNPDIDFLLGTTGRIYGSSDRVYARKIYSQLLRLTPIPSCIKADFDVLSTVGLQSEERVRFFDDFYSYRSQYAERISQLNKATEADVELAKRLNGIISNQRERFRVSDDLFSLNVTLGFLACKR